MGAPKFLKITIVYFEMIYWVNDHLTWFFYSAILPETAFKVDVRENITEDNLSQHLFI